MHGESPPASGAVELREDVPLKGAEGGAGGARCCAGGPRLILACFAALSAAITLALFTQIYYGDYEVVPHGSVSSSAAACSRAGTDALKAGGRALDAAAAAALCLAVVAPHRTSLDASGSMVYWEYRLSRTQQPMLYEWGGVPAAGDAAGDAAGSAAGDAAGSAAGDAAGGAEGARPPRLVAALAVLHAELGALPWPRLLQPAIDLARNGFPVSASLAAALAVEAASGAGGAASGAASPPADSLSTAPQLAAYLESLQVNTSAELAAAWGAGAVRRGAPAAGAAGARRVLAGGARAPLVLRALAAALDPPPRSLDDAQDRVVSALVSGAAGAAGAAGGGGVATGLAAVDRRDTYLALVTGLSEPFGTGPEAAAGWTRDRPAAALDLAPALLLDREVCGTRYVLGAESGAALAQAAAALAAGGGAAAVERARVALTPAGAAPEPRAAPAAAAVNLVQQTADALLSHADSRGGGLASRF